MANSLAKTFGDTMTPTPSHVATDELIETLERRRTKSMAFEREFGLEGRTICPDDLDALFVTLSISEASALISALKENKRMREALEAIPELIADQADHDVLAVVWTALQPQGEK